MKRRDGRMTYSHSEDGAAGMPPLYIMQQCDRRSTVVSIPEWIFLQYNSMSDSFVYPHCRTATPTQRECSWLPPVGFQTYLNLCQHLSLWLGLFLCIFFLSLVGHGNTTGAVPTIDCNLQNVTSSKFLPQPILNHFHHCLLCSNVNIEVQLFLFPSGFFCSTSRHPIV